MNDLLAYQGGCHCGAVRFRALVDRHEAILCNCSICTKKGFLHLILPKERFTLLCGEAALATYTFNTRVARHMFCRICGVHPFYSPRSHPDGVDVNVRCLDGDVVERFHIAPFDGARWEESIGSLVEPTRA
jgi:hypothetical protein